MQNKNPDRVMQDPDANPAYYTAKEINNLTQNITTIILLI